MTDAPDIENFRQRKYDYVVSREGGNYSVVISELCLISTGPDVQGCIAKIDLEKEELFKNFVSMGQVDQLPLPGSQQSLKAGGQESQTLTQYVVRSSILALIVVLGMGFFGLVLSARLEPFFHYTYVRDVVSKVAVAIVDDLGSPRGKEWGANMETLRNAREKIQEIQDVLNETPDKEDRRPRN